FTALEVSDDAVLRRQVAVERIGECAALHRADAEHAGARFFARGDDLAGAARPGEILELTWGAERVVDAVHGGGTGIPFQRRQDAFWNPDAGNAPGADTPVGNESLARRNEALDISSPACDRTIGIGTGVVGVRNDVRVQEEQVDPLEPHACEALLEAAHQ